MGHLDVLRRAHNKASLQKQGTTNVAVRSVGVMPQRRQWGSGVMLSFLDQEKVCAIIRKRREFEAVLDPDSSGTAFDASGEGYASTLTMANAEPIRTELTALIEALDVNEARELEALLFVGRGDFARDEWSAALQQARTRSASGARPCDYIADMPMAADYLEDGLVVFDLFCEEPQHRAA
jgi:hypothetical protein